MCLSIDLCKSEQKVFNLDGYSTETMTKDQFVSWLISNEWDDRCNKMIARLIKNAAFRYNASIEEIDYSIDRGLDRNTMDRLADLSFVKEAKDLFITGCTGTGKSYIATALGMRAFQKGFRVMYTNTYKLMGKLKVAKAKGDILKELKRIEKTDVLILEDFCMHPFDSGSRMSLMDIIESLRKEDHHPHFSGAREKLVRLNRRQDGR